MDVTKHSVRRPVRSAVVVNPSKVDDLDDFRSHVDAALTSAGWPTPRWYHTTPSSPGREQTGQAIKAGAEIVFVFVCGGDGDGTILSAVSALVDTDTALAVLPAGTGNLLAANLGLSDDLTAGLQVAQAADTKSAAAQLGHASEGITSTYYIAKPVLVPDVSDILEQFGTR
ncbi:diacylglycerol/lipid kinase family protein [Phytohabitans sp. LJ34]|uniref:diacylglycerol/lipid kinase family protein n=1 Tax=Phytohabitans sp. LJ34 TaxID=3452217 RepID=UPI003F8B0D9E